MLIKTYKINFVASLFPLYDKEEIESFFYIILEELHQKKRIDIALAPNLIISENDLKKWDAIVEQLKLEIPIQYCLGKTNFFGLDFEVNNATLIPRPETEELVSLVLSENRLVNNSTPRILDIGTGSGCIAIALAKNLPTASVTAIDVSSDALAVAKKNAERNNVQVFFIQRDILRTTDLGPQFDCIVSNPPYVRHLEKEEMKKNVLDYEPHLALFVADDDALVFYKKIGELALKSLVQGGKLYFEINQYLGKETVTLLEQMGYKKVQLLKDCYGNDRMIRASI
jgi:release factor glutamine methyltransferase